jgi:hypothetical protein
VTPDLRIADAREMERELLKLSERYLRTWDDVTQFRYVLLHARWKRMIRERSTS